VHTLHIHTEKYAQPDGKGFILVTTRTAPIQAPGQHKIPTAVRTLPNARGGQRGSTRWATTAKARYTRPTRTMEKVSLRRQLSILRVLSMRSFVRERRGPRPGYLLSPLWSAEHRDKLRGPRRVCHRGPRQLQPVVGQRTNHATPSRRLGCPILERPLMRTPYRARARPRAQPRQEAGSSR
jgi:hypothetical protein